MAMNNETAAGRKQLCSKSAIRPFVSGIQQLTRTVILSARLDTIAATQVVS
jgi:hypothetical protein